MTWANLQPYFDLSMELSVLALVVGTRWTDTCARRIEIHEITSPGHIPRRLHIRENLETGTNPYS